MKNLFKNTGLICCLLACLLMVTGCSDDSLDKQTSNFGYFQLKLRKQIQTYALTGGSELENLNDAKKIQIDLLYNNRQLSQTLNLAASSAEAAELGLTSETIELLAGNYTLTGYKIYGEFIEGVTEGDSAPILQEGEPDEPMHFDVVTSQLKIVSVDVTAQRRGQLSLILDKDFSNIKPEMKAAGFDPESFRYDDIAKVQIDIKAGQNGAIRQYEFKTRRSNVDYLFHTDTVNLRVNDYNMVQMRLMDKYDKLIMVVDKPHRFVIEDETLLREPVSIDMPMTPAFRDYIALYNIWKAMDGENWSWLGNGFNPGANFLFTYSDGTPRPFDLWGAQPGVALDARGRVKSLNLGSFNPKGMVPDAIGDLTALQTLYLGNHTDEALIDPNEGMASIDRYALDLKGIDLRANRIAIAKEELAIRHPRKASTLTSWDKKPEPFRFATYGGVQVSDASNRITGISEAIGNCKELSYLSVAKGLVTDLPESLGDLDNLTDLEIYQCPMSDIPACVLRMKGLVAFNFASNTNLDPVKIQASLRKFFDGPSNKVVQLLYLPYNNLTELPDNLNKMTNLGLLDLAGNKLTSVPMLGKDVALVQCFLDENQITEIPENWFFIDDLEKISFANNKLTTFPNMFDAKSAYTISEINLSGNHMSKMPENFRGVNVEILNMNSNYFDHLPEEFSDTESKFNFLQISNNRLDTISPNSVKNLKNLKALECTGNRLRNIPNEFNIEALPFMTGVDLSMNQFERFPMEVLYVGALTELRMASQFNHQTGKRTLAEWPEGIDQHPTLRVFDISGNDIRNVGSFPLLLNMLNIQDNPNIYITVPELILYRMITGSFLLLFDEDQHVEGI